MNTALEMESAIIELFLRDALKNRTMLEERRGPWLGTRQLRITDQRGRTHTLGIGEDFARRGDPRQMWLGATTLNEEQDAAIRALLAEWGSTTRPKRKDAYVIPFEPFCGDDAIVHRDQLLAILRPYDASTD